METDLDRLKFIVNFAQTDLRSLRPGDMLNLRDDLGVFIHGRIIPPLGAERVQPGGVEPFVVKLVGDLTVDELETLQKKCMGVLSHASVGRGGLDYHGDQVITAVYSLAPRLPDGRKWTVFVGGRANDVVPVILIHLLMNRPLNTLRACPECDRIFVRVRKQRYCSTKCSTRVYMRSYRQTENGKDSQAAASRRTYVKRVRKQTGSGKVTPARRPRKRKENA